MNVRVTFADGTSEERGENSPAVPHFAGPPSTLYVGYHEGRIVTGHTTELSCLRRCRALVWCITGGRGVGELLRGEWRECKVESLEEQIWRLTTERDMARAALQSLLDDCATWRAHRGATGMGAHLPHDLMSAPPSVVQYIERAAKQGLGQ